MDCVILEELPDDIGEANKSVYAYFGLAMYLAQCLEHGIVNALLALDHLPSAIDKKIHKSKESWETYIDKHYDKSFANYFGTLVGKLIKTPNFPEEIAIGLQASSQKRNRLAHRFFREHASSWFNRDSLNSMRIELVDCANLFNKTNKDLDAYLVPILTRHGIKEEDIDKLYAEMTSAQTTKQQK